MFSKRVIRYYCDFCRKGGFRKPSMESHERGCTANPARICGLCGLVGEENLPLKELLEALTSGGIEELEKKAQDCPACMLAACRAWNKAGNHNSGSEEGYWFDYKQKHEAWWNEYHHVNQGPP